MSEQQTARAVLMVRPAHFGSNAETAASNFFQRSASGESGSALRAQHEFDSLALALAGAGVRVHQFAGQRSAALPDEVFPNNWLSLHADGTAVLYPMLAPSRRLERRRDILDALVDSCGYRIDQVVDLTGLEARGEYLEGTGSVVLDRIHRVAYACLSPRTHVNALAELARALRYEVVPFTAVDASGRAIYHTNVVLSLGTRFAALCTAAIADAAERRSVVARLEASGREVVDLSRAELEGFACNLLELAGAGGPVIAMSAAALRALATTTRGALERYGRFVTADIATIERLGGGSVRCMLAEVALPTTARDGGSAANAGAI
ncbi:MAG TPA: arginine deiminase-related protein [Gammaproteobacteria bacterium]|nr:arginine deiminase-related protein [Gammaproteobacteria bacterium]